MNRQKALTITLLMILLVPPASFLLHPSSFALSQPLRLSPSELAGRLQDAGDDPVRLLQLTPHAEPAEAAALRTRVGELLRENHKSFNSNEMRVVARGLAPALSVLRSPAEVVEVLGAGHTVHRQLLYRQYREVWVYERPLPLVLHFICRKGQEPELQTVQVLPVP